MKPIVRKQKTVNFIKERQKYLATPTYTSVALKFTMKTYRVLQDFSPFWDFYPYKRQLIEAYFSKQLRRINVDSSPCYTLKSY